MVVHYHYQHLVYDLDIYLALLGMWLDPYDVDQVDCSAAEKNLNLQPGHRGTERRNGNEHYPSDEEDGVVRKWPHAFISLESPIEVGHPVLDGIVFESFLILLHKVKTQEGVPEHDHKHQRADHLVSQCHFNIVHQGMFNFIAKRHTEGDICNCDGSDQSIEEK